MSVGFVMLVHEEFGRAAEVARHLAERNCPVVIHVDKRVAISEFQAFSMALGDLQNVAFGPRRKCNWGTWSLVEASRSSAQILLNLFPDVGHVFLISGSCLPLRSVADLKAFLVDHASVDFIESVTIDEVPWTQGGFDKERFLFSFPFSWKRNKFLFDRWVAIQRKLGLSRKVPKDIVPHLGSQWWCLTRETLAAILNDPERKRFDRFFRRVWIPDESYYQTLVRRFSKSIESRSLTLAKFDFVGQPHVFYDDHLGLLRSSEAFFARKIWARADRLYRAFLSDNMSNGPTLDMSPARIDRTFAQAIERRTRGRGGLVMQSRYPKEGFENAMTAGPYGVFHGFGDLFEGFEAWLAKNTGTRVHGHLFALDRVHFADNQSIYAGALPDSAALRDYNPGAFLTSLIWNTRGEHQSFLFSPRDNQEITDFVARDPNAMVSIVSGAWAVPLFRSKRSINTIRAEAARLQKLEAANLEMLRERRTRARVRIWSMADFMERPAEPLQMLIDDLVGPGARRLTEMPRLVNLHGFGTFLQQLKNAGMNPHLVGDFPAMLDDVAAEANSSDTGGTALGAILDKKARIL